MGRNEPGAPLRKEACMNRNRSNQHGDEALLPPMVVLAAGRSTRMGFPKVLAPLGGRTLLEAHVETWYAHGCREVVVVLGHGADRVLRRVNLAGARVVVNADHDRGQFSSVQTGLQALVDARPGGPGVDGGADGAFVVPADCPPVSRAVIRRLWTAISAHPSALAAVPAVDGRRGHPVLLTKRGVDKVLEAPSTATLAGVLSSFGGQALTVETGEKAILWNINTPEDLRRYLAGELPPR